MPRQAVDFGYVEEKHRGIHMRLEEWAIWVKPRRHSAIHPMFRQYRSPETWIAPEAKRSVDPLVAQATEKAVTSLPETHRAAVQWCYVFRTHPRRMCQALGVRPEELGKLIRDGRQMLINRGLTP